VASLPGAVARGVADYARESITAPFRQAKRLGQGLADSADLFGDEEGFLERRRERIREQGIGEAAAPGSAVAASPPPPEAETDRDLEALLEPPSQKQVAQAREAARRGETDLDVEALLDPPSSEPDFYDELLLRNPYQQLPPAAQETQDHLVELHNRHPMLSEITQPSALKDAELAVMKWEEQGLPPATIATLLQAHYSLAMRPG